MATETVCKFFQFGHCKFGEKCKKNHVKENCDKTICEIQACQLRHPKTCKYFSIYQFCKFGDYCDFKHPEKNDGSQIEELNQKVSALEAKVCELESLIEQVIGKESAQEAEDAYEDEETHETEHESDSDTNIDHSECVERGFCRHGDTSTEEEMGKSFKCDKCDFTSNSEMGVNIHRGKQHGPKKKRKKKNWN